MKPTISLSPPAPEPSTQQYADIITLAREALSAGIKSGIDMPLVTKFATSLSAAESRWKHLDITERQHQAALLAAQGEQDDAEQQDSTEHHAPLPGVGASASSS